MRKKTYMDYNATAPLRPEAREAMIVAMQAPHNASSPHGYGRKGRKIIEQAREKIAALTGAPPGQVIFNSGATEGNNTVLQHFANAFPEDQILVSAIEHPSVLDVWPDAKHVPVSPDGVLDLTALEDILKTGKTSLVSVMLVNNETGVVQPVAEAAALAKRYGALFHCDAVQAAGHIPIDIDTLGVDFLTLSAHKIGGPQGAGALVLGLCGITPKLLLGGGQEKKARAGTENVAAIAGFGAAAEAARSGLTSRPAKLKRLRDHLECKLCEVTGSQAGKTDKNRIIIHGRNAARAPGTTMFSLPGASSETLLMALDLEDIAVSNGAACSSGKVEPSRVLMAMGRSREEAKSALRISLGWASTEHDIERFLSAWTQVCERLSKKRREVKKHA